MLNARLDFLLYFSTVSANNLFSFAEPCDNMREILQNVAKLQGVSNMRKLGHLNNFTKVRVQMVS